MSDINDSMKLFVSTCNGDRVEMNKVKRELGYAFKPLLGLYNGYYCLDLKQDLDRLCLIKLIEVSKTRMDRVQGNNDPYLLNVGDISQKGNWSCFRNEVFNGEPFVLTPEFASPSLPTGGKLEFDFVYALRPKYDDFPISDSKFTKLLIKHFLIPKEAEAKIVDTCNKIDIITEKLVKCTGDNLYICSLKRSEKIAAAMEDFYGSLPTRCDAIMKSDVEVSDLNSSSICDDDSVVFDTGAKSLTPNVAPPPKEEAPVLVDRRRVAFIGKGPIDSAQRDTIVAEKFFTRIQDQVSNDEIFFNKLLLIISYSLYLFTFSGDGSICWEDFGFNGYF